MLHHLEHVVVGFWIGRGLVGSCSHGESSVILPKQDIFEHRVVAQSASAWRLASFPELSGQHQVENGTAHVRRVRHNQVLFVCERQLKDASPESGADTSWI